MSRINSPFRTSGTDFDVEKGLTLDKTLKTLYLTLFLI